MDNLRKSIELFFRHIDSEHVLKYLENQKLCRDPFHGGLKQPFMQKGREEAPHYSKDEWENIVQKLDEDWLFDPYKQKGKSIFNLLVHFNKQALLIEADQPLVNDEYLLRWRELSYAVGEDLLTCAHLAYMDSRASRKRSFYAWKPVIGTNNPRLKQLLKKGVAENHFHLKGSAPIFALSWISLMNQITGRSQDFNRLQKTGRQILKQVVGFDEKIVSLPSLVQMAAVIRMELFKLINGRQVSENLFKLVATRDFKLDLANYQADLVQLKYLHGFKFNHLGKSVAADYAIPKNLHSQNFENNVLLCGERIFLTGCFRKIYEKDSTFSKYTNLFYLYLIIKEKLREELVQVNSKVGFGNFLDYQNRKEIFIAEGSIYDTAFLSMAVKDTVRNQKIYPFETRITPKHKKTAQIKAIKKCDQQINSSFFQEPKDGDLLHYFLEKKSKLEVFPNFYVLHFIKQQFEEKNKKRLAELAVPRDNVLRNKIEQEAKAIVRLKESTSKVGQRIFGIDAASSEMAARPEVFSQVFRFLKDHKKSGRLDHLKDVVTENPLGSTYHAGEDFLDLVDGLRAIDETIVFLKFRKGDRLGHALALGIDPREYYDFKNRTLLLQKQDVLDNICWIIAKSKEYGLKGHEQELARLNGLYERLFSEVYACNMQDNQFKHTSPDIYFKAWQLRGDAPDLYQDWTVNPLSFTTLTFWDRCKINYSYPVDNHTRKNIDVRFLYHTYHYNAKVKVLGSAIMQHKVGDGYIKLISALQEQFLREIGRKEIAIECNPTSNYLIGTFKRYANHPIKRFYNLGLTNDSEEIRKSPQIMVSINTDDQGVFGTSLENEYALLLIALKKETNEDGTPAYNISMIYDWLDRIRQMGVEMSFFSR